MAVETRLGRSVDRTLVMNYGVGQYRWQFQHVYAAIKRKLATKKSVGFFGIESQDLCGADANFRQSCSGPGKLSADACGVVNCGSTRRGRHRSLLLPGVQPESAGNHAAVRWPYPTYSCSVVPGFMKGRQLIRRGR